MFRFLLKLLGLEKYEYQEPVPEQSKNSVIAGSITTNTVLEEKTTSTFEQEVELPSEQAPVQVQQSTPEKAAPEVKNVAQPIISEEKEVIEKSILQAFKGLKSNYAQILIKAGFDSINKIEQSSDQELLALKGIGKATIAILRKKTQA
ncbi:MAG: hypothetical protein QM479_09810 [Pseudomonadota bacterium]